MVAGLSYAAMLAASILLASALLDVLPDSISGLFHVESTLASTSDTNCLRVASTA